jgi:hypothetical protein
MSSSADHRSSHCTDPRDFLQRRKRYVRVSRVVQSKSYGVDPNCQRDTTRRHEMGLLSPEHKPSSRRTIRNPENKKLLTLLGCSFTLISSILPLSKYNQRSLLFFPLLIIGRAPVGVWISRGSPHTYHNFLPLPL